MRTLCVFVLLFGLVFGSEDVLHIKQGLIKGSELTSRDGRVFKAFQGIPYAKPPIGDLRFRDPIPASSWKGVFEATTESFMCLQKNIFVYIGADIITGDEDCLYLNVYTPKIPEKGDKLLPVMVWIPGGGFSSGTGGLKLNGPHYLLDKDVVVVSFNYRLGILGFLSTEDEVLPGNLGMKDQVLALKWVRDNIEKFGGNPNKVTIVGESAGSVSVSLHLLSPMSKGLFHKVIMESGSALVSWGVSPPGLARQRALTVSTLTGCPSDTTKLIECLRKVPAKIFANMYTNFYEWKTHPIITFMPVVENCDKNTNKTESFLCRYPLLDFKQESKVPVIIGMNSGEGGIFASRMHGITGFAYDELEEDFGFYLSSMLQYRYTTKSSDIGLIGGKVFERYYPDGTMSDPLNSVKMVSGGLFFHGIIKMALKLSQPVHFYLYDHANLLTCNMIYGSYPLPKKLGVSHGDEIISLFHIIGKPGLIGEDFEVSKLMVDLWTSFFTNDTLTIDGKNGSEKWPTFDSTSYKFLMINSSKPVIDEKPSIDEYEFWDSLPLLSRFFELPKNIKTEL